MCDGHQHAFKQWLETMAGVSDGMLTAGAARLQLTMEMWSALAGCRSPEALIDWSRHAHAKLMEHCAGEIARLSQMTMGMALLRPGGSGSR